MEPMPKPPTTVARVEPATPAISEGKPGFASTRPESPTPKPGLPEPLPDSESPASPPRKFGSGMYPSEKPAQLEKTEHPIYSRVVDMSSYSMSSFVYDGFGIRKPAGAAKLGLINHSPAGVLHMVAIALDKVGRASIPSDARARITVSNGYASRVYEFSPKMVPSQYGISPSTFHSVMKAERSLDGLCRTLSGGISAIPIKALLTNVDQDGRRLPSNSLQLTYKTDYGFTKNATVELSFVKGR